MSRCFSFDLDTFPGALDILANNCPCNYCLENNCCETPDDRTFSAIAAGMRLCSLRWPTGALWMHSRRRLNWKGFCLPLPSNPNLQSQALSFSAYRPYRYGRHSGHSWIFSVQFGEASNYSYNSEVGCPWHLPEPLLHQLYRYPLWNQPALAPRRAQAQWGNSEPKFSSNATTT